MRVPRAASYDLWPPQRWLHTLMCDLCQTTNARAPRRWYHRREGDCVGGLSLGAFASTRRLKRGAAHSEVRGSWAAGRLGCRRFVFTSTHPSCSRPSSATLAAAALASASVASADVLFQGSGGSCS